MLKKEKQKNEGIHTALNTKNENLGNELNEAKLNIIDLKHAVSNKDIEINDLTRKLETNNSILTKSNNRIFSGCSTISSGWAS